MECRKTQPQEPLDYRTPKRRAPTATRKKACQQALTNGVVCVGISLLLGAGSLGKLGPFLNGAMRFTEALKWAMFWVNAAGYLSCGVLYLIASAKIRERNVRWERTLLVSGVVQLGIVLLTLCATFFGDTNRLPDAMEVIGLTFNLGVVLLLIHMLQLACRACLWGE